MKNIYIKNISIVFCGRPSVCGNIRYTKIITLRQWSYYTQFEKQTSCDTVQATEARKETADRCDFVGVEIMRITELQHINKVNAGSFPAKGFL